MSPYFHENQISLIILSICDEILSSGFENLESTLEDYCGFNKYLGLSEENKRLCHKTVSEQNTFLHSHLFKHFQGVGEVDQNLLNGKLACLCLERVQFAWYGAGQFNQQMDNIKIQPTK